MEEPCAVAGTVPCLGSWTVCIERVRGCHVTSRLMLLPSWPPAVMACVSNCEPEPTLSCPIASKCKAGFLHFILLTRWVLTLCWAHLCEIMWYEGNYKVLGKSTYKGQVTMHFRQVRHGCREYQGSSLESGNKNTLHCISVGDPALCALETQSATEMTASGAWHCWLRAGRSMFTLPN